METLDSDWKLPWAGGCRCNKVRFRVTQPPLVSAACHCTGCQRMSSSAFSLTLILPSAGFEILAGEPVQGGLHDPQQRHMFCGYCMTWMFTHPGMEGIINLRPTMLDDPRWFVPFIETYTDEKLPWASTPAVHSFGKLPDPGAYGALMQEYAARGARPR